MRARLQSGPAVTEAEVDKLQSLVSLVGRYLHPLSPSSERSEKVLRFLHHHPEIMQQRLADHLFLSCIDLHHDRCVFGYWRNFCGQVVREQYSQYNARVAAAFARCS